jgi:hypothetical protein
VLRLRFPLGHSRSLSGIAPGFWLPFHARDSDFSHGGSVHPVAYLSVSTNFGPHYTGRTDMLKIIDLNRNEELSSSEMGKLAGGSAQEALSAWGRLMREAGFDNAADILDPPADIGAWSPPDDMPTDPGAQ